MFRFPLAPSRRFTGDALGSVVALAMAATVSCYLTAWFLFQWPFPDILPHLASLCVGLTACGAVALVWISLRAAGLVGPGTGAGLRLAALAIVALASVDILSACGSFWYPDVARPEVEPAPRLAWLVRNTSLVAFGLGLGLVIVSSAIDLRRRRSAPSWTRPVD